MGKRVLMTRRIHRSGNSVQVTIPKPLGEALGFEIGDEVKLYVCGQVLCVQKVDPRGFVPGVVAVRSAPIGERFQDESRE